MASVTEADPSTESSSSRATSRLVSAGALMAAGTMTSRVLGFVRVALLAFLIGNGTRQADMYDIASSIPTSLYILFAGGALNTVLVPQLVRAVKNDGDDGEAYTNRIMTAFGLIVAVVALVATLGTPIVIGRIYTSAEWHRPEMAAHLESMFLLGHFFLPQIFLYGVFFLLGQVLNARDHFGPMMWAPVVNNVVQIAVLGTYLGIYGTSDGADPFTAAQATLLGGGATFGIACQTAVMVVCLHRAGYRFRPRFDLRGTGLGHTFSLAKWTLGFVLLNQLAFLVVTRLATSATVGGAGAGIAAYNKAYLIFILPHSLITVSLATAMLPSASRLAADGDLHGVAREAMRTMRLVTAVLLPAAVAFLALGGPVADLMFGNGAGAGDAGFVGWTLRAFALGLLPFTLQYVCLRAFYALENTRITFFLQLLIAGVQVGVAVALVVPFHTPAWVAPALAAAFAAAYLVGFGVSFGRLHRDLPDLHFLELARQMVRVGVAILPAGLVAWGGSVLIRRLDAGTPLALAILAGVGVVAVLIYLGLARALRIGEVTQIIGTIWRRGSATSPDPTTDPVPSGIEDSLPQDATGDVDDEAEVDTVIRPAVDPHGTDPHGTDPHGADADAEATPVSYRSGSFFDAGPRHPIHAEAGDRLVDRYVLDEPLVQRPETQTWVATDQVLSRSVMIHLLPRGFDRNDELLEAARRSAIATDARFLRVLDAATEPGPGGPDGPFVVCEHTAGESLTAVLADGPLTALEAGWLAREVADALAGMHGQGLYHQRISPDSVIITGTGNVKIVGFAPHAVLERHPDAGQDPARTDVEDVAKLLYAAMTARYPGGPAHGLGPVPTDATGAWVPPREVRAGVSPALDQICQRVLVPGVADPIESMSQLVRALGRIMGTADASDDLERRLTHPGQGPADEEWAAEATEPVGLGSPVPGALYRDEVDDDPSAERTRALPADTAHDPDTMVEEAGVEEAGVAGEVADDLPVREPEPSRRWLAVLLGVVAVIAVVGVFVAVSGRGGGPRVEPDAPAAPQPQVVQITGAVDFDPQGDDRRENPDLVDLAHDGDPATSWDTVVYRNANMAPKDGVGVTFDLAAEVEVTQVRVTLVNDGTNLDIRVPDGENWRKVGEARGAGREAVVEIAPTRTGQVQVWLTNLPTGTQGGYQGGIAEVEVTGLP